MKAISYISFFVLPVALLGQDISTPQKRMASLDLARALLTTQQTIETAERLEGKNPFSPKIPVVEERTAVVPVAVAVADRERLLLLAPQVTPSGSVFLGDTALLLFGQKRLKVGDSIPIVFQGVTYALQISAIERTTFTLRLNNEEITRPIKPVK
ncbi:MAG: hypothetical protein ACAH89_03425 [Rariglobus sp.]|nr:hypothetical protein [Rariglobus sp.]